MSANFALLAVRGDRVFEEALRSLRVEGLTVSWIESAQQAMAALGKEAPRFVVLDADALGAETIPFMRRLHRLVPLTDILLLARDGKFDEPAPDSLIDKTLPLEEIRELLTEAIAVRRLLDEAGMFGHSPNLREAARRIQQVAPTDISVLVTGPSGSGKELIARAIHNNSPRADREYISLNCASIPEALLESELFGYEKGAFTGADRTQPGLLQQAHGGTLFLDEIGEMHPRLQAKLLRAIDTKTFMAVGGRKTTVVDVRFIAATNRDLQSEVEAGNFRADLYYRLSVITIQMQRLSERPEDILPIIAHNLGRLKSSIRFSPEATEMLLRYSWPGNVRELTNFLQRLLVTSPSGEVSRETVASLLDKHRLDDRSLPVVTNLTAEESGYRLIYQALLNLANEVIDLKRLIHERLGGGAPAQPQAVHTEQSGGDLEAMEEQLIRETLQRVGGNRKKAATILGIGERTLYRKLRKFNLM